MILPELRILLESFIFQLTLLILPAILLVGVVHRFFFQYVTPRREPRENLDRITVYADYEEVHLDIVIVHGLGAHPYYSWKANGPSSDSREARKGDGVGINWLEHEDFLKQDFKNVRILSYSYNADWFVDASLTTASQKALTFLEVLSGFRQKTKKTPPILFIGHSFGGIIVKYAIHLAHSDSHFTDTGRDTAVVTELLSGTEPVEVTANYHTIDITPDITTCATNNRRFRLKVLETLKDHFGKLPVDLGTYSSAMRRSSGMLKYLLAKVDHLPSIEDIVNLASNERGVHFNSSAL
ncbi:hypothetical protein F5Y11DRAFT_352028 [Daldinia sp. FL1419]|nr:hypothetical protein F5Y11DRAFT_352028 [Daldinia sp. FL1419]